MAARIIRPLVFFLGTLLALISFTSLLTAGQDGEPTMVENDLCVYTVYISTGSAWKSGTDSVIGIKICGAAAGDCLSIRDLEAWGGIMWPGHDYFELGNVDAFSGRGHCLASPPCSVELLSDGSGSSPGWYCDYVQVAATGPQLPCSQRTFKVAQWLARDEPPFKLRAMRDECGGGGGETNQTDNAALRGLPSWHA
ncbi:hypothetical protein Taro_047231 [Colocasia esculenta]|uniref:PLAT domain-containing protein n=1 Tax=Colocasia esculenta TaxID=4460 RepID=A0A843X569_COLES|nr:hypothetical protein [Colocasia esculenta]